jgi:hypothetical protein
LVWALLGCDGEHTLVGWGECGRLGFGAWRQQQSSAHHDQWQPNGRDFRRQSLPAHSCQLDERDPASRRHLIGFATGESVPGPAEGTPAGT